MSNIAKRPNGQWRARYRDAACKEHARHFDRKVDAQRWLNSVTAAVETGNYVDPRAGRITLGEWAEKWFEGQAQLKPTTRSRYRGILDGHVLPHWSATRLVAVSHADVQAWVAEQRAAGAAPATVRKHFRVLSLVLDLAVRDGRLPRNPCQGVNLPRLEQARRRYLTHEQVHRLADETCSLWPGTRLPYRERETMASYRLIVLVLAYCGLRWGELAALKVERVDLARRRIEVAESVVEVDGVLIWAFPRATNAGRCPSRGSSPTTCASTWQTGRPTTWSSPACAAGESCATGSSAEPASTGPPQQWAWTAWCLTSSGTRPRAWRCPPGPT